MKSKFQTHYERIRSKPEVNDGETKVEKTGYIPAKTRIEQFLRAGLNLQIYKKEMFDTDVGYKDYEDIPCDVTRKLDYDMAEAFQHIHGIHERQKEARRMASEALKSSPEAPKASSDTSTTPPA